MTAGAPLGLGPIGQIGVNVRDLPRAVRYYRETLGMRFLFEVPKMAFFDCGGVRLMLGIAESAELDHPASVIYYRVPDIHQAHELLAGRGVRFRGAPHLVARLPDHDLWMAFFQDPEGNTLALMSEVRDAATGTVEG